MEKFYAITALGWGVGSTVEEAIDNYEKAQHRNFPKLSDDELAEAWGFVWQVPSETAGFYDTPSGMFWSFDGKDGEQADLDQRVAYVGNVPEFAQFTEEKEEV